MSSWPRLKWPKQTPSRMPPLQPKHDRKQQNSCDDGWNEGPGAHGRVASVESATGGESDPRVYDASVHGVELLEESNFGILAYRQLGLVPRGLVPADHLHNSRCSGRRTLLGNTYG